MQSIAKDDARRGACAGTAGPPSAGFTPNPHETILYVSQSVLIVGAGITGLATAYYLSRAGLDVTVLEATEHVGGKIATVPVAQMPVDVGPDAFLARGADLQQLVQDLGLSDAIVEPAVGSYIWSRGRLRPIPPGMAFGLPERLLPLLRSGLLSPAEVARAGLDLVAPATKVGEDPSIAELVRPRFGEGVYRRLVEPLLGGVHAGDPAQLSAKSTAPEIYAIANGHRSVYSSLRKRRAASPPPTSKRSAPLVSLQGGLSTLTTALVARIGSVLTGQAVTSLNRQGNTWVIDTDDHEYRADTLVLAIPAHQASPLLAPLSLPLAGLLADIPFVDVANTTLAFRRVDLPELPKGTGFLAPPVEDRFIVGCTWLTNKWPYLANDETTLIKCMVGRAGDDRWLKMSDAEIVTGVRRDLADLLGITVEPCESRVQRWPQAMPQYVTGHAERIAHVSDLVATLGGLHLTGSSYKGSGLAACATAASTTAAAIAQGVAA